MEKLVCSVYPILNHFNLRYLPNMDLVFQTSRYPLIYS